MATMTPMKNFLKKSYYKHRFDFEIGYLVKSPCRRCETRRRFPKCMDECKILDKIQDRMAGSISCTRHA